MKKILNTLSVKWPEYLLEIFVLIIGIYGAFELDNWKDERNNKKLEKLVLNQIKDDLNDNLVDVSKDLLLLELSYLSDHEIYGYIEQDVPYQKSFCFDFHFLIKDEFTTANSAGYDNLKEYGMDLISNDSIKNYLRFIYERALPRLTPATAFYEDLDTFFGPYYNKHFIPNSDTLLHATYIIKGDTLQFPEKTALEGDIVSGMEEWVLIGYVPLDFEALKKDPEFFMLLKRSQNKRIHKLEWYRLTKSNMESAIKAIEKELNIL